MEAPCNADPVRHEVELENAYLSGTVSLSCLCGLTITELSFSEAMRARRAHLDGEGAQI